MFDIRGFLYIMVCGGTLIGPGELFCGAACGHIKQISTDGLETGSGGTFFGAGFNHIKQISTNGGGTWPGPGGFFVPKPMI